MPWSKYSNTTRYGLLHGYEGTHAPAMKVGRSRLPPFFEFPRHVWQSTPQIRILNAVSWLSQNRGIAVHCEMLLHVLRVTSLAIRSTISAYYCPNIWAHFRYFSFFLQLAHRGMKQVVYTSWDRDALCPDSESNDDYRATYTTSGLILCRLDHIKPLLSLLKPRIYLLNLLISACQLLQASGLSKAVVKLKMDMNSLPRLKPPTASQKAFIVKRENNHGSNHGTSKEHNIWSPRTTFQGSLGF